MLSDIAVPSKNYPRLTIDLKEFPGIDGEVDDNFEAVIQGRICAKSHSDYSHTLDIEVRKISECESGGNPKRIAILNIADQELDKMKRRSL